MSIQVEKHIPVAAGLGGASSDAAAVLVSANRVWGQCMDQDQLHREAASLGSDVPFFLTGPCAIATGTGTDLEPLPRPRGWLLIVTPPFSLPEKTRAMYAALQPGDYTDGARAASVAWALRAGRMPDPADLHNAFARPLYELAPELARIPEILRQHGAELAALSGAGPSHYGWFRDAAGARGAIGQMARRLPKKTRLDVAPFSSLRLEDRLTVSPT